MYNITFDNRVNFRKTRRLKEQFINEFLKKISNYKKLLIRHYFFLYSLIKKVKSLFMQSVLHNAIRPNELSRSHLYLLYAILMMI